MANKDEDTTLDVVSLRLGKLWLGYIAVSAEQGQLS